MTTTAAAAAAAPIRFGRETTGVLADAENLEWLVTNGIGGYGSGTVAGSISRGYHGLLVAARRPPVDRRLMLVKLDETVRYRGETVELATNRWTSGAVAPTGHIQLESFELEGSVPVWRYTVADAVLEKRVWMQQGANTTYVAYTLVRSGAPLELSLSAIVDNRVFHNTGQVAWPADVTAVPGGLQIISGGADNLPLTILIDSGEPTTAAELYQDYLLPAETLRGLGDADSHVHAGTFTASLAPGQTVLILASAEQAPAIDPDALSQRRSRDAATVAAWRGNRASADAPLPAWVERLVLAADQFVVTRPTPGRPDGMSVIAGYHWFEDWGRDTMISLPGLTLVTGRPAVAASILRAFATFVSDGMLPNRFPDGAAAPVYNTIDATLWYFQAIRSYVVATRDLDLLRELWPTLTDIVAWHLKGTRYNIKVDPADGLLAGGTDGVQLTWMDAIVDGRVITPRIGKPVEVNALWYNALVAMDGFAAQLGEDGSAYRGQAAITAQGFARFFNRATGYCFDVLDSPQGDDPALRPNQLLAVSLPAALLTGDQQRSVVDACAHALLTSRGVRSLARTDAAYVGFYGGDQAHRDAAYHQGTVWAWLIGPLVEAHLRVFGDPDAAFDLLMPFGDHLASAGLGTISEIFSGDPPFTPVGCIAQAWSVAEVLRSVALIEQFRRSASGASHGPGPEPDHDTTPTPTPAPDRPRRTR
ncbi:MAG TPA: amylo-alpha-1,6-glucosidase [Microlunatus sp.]|nr:amylo-alpha-1,6-glucosidase [Microlunatus sp.]